MKFMKLISGLAALFLAGSLWAFILMRADNGAVIHWSNLSPVYLVNNNSANSTTKLCVADPVATVQNAFSAWNNAAPLTISVTYGGTTSLSDFCGKKLDDTGCDSTNLVLFSSQWEGGAFPAGALALTVSYYDTGDGVLGGVDMIFNDGIKWSDDPLNHANASCKGSSVYSISAVANHEAGHFYGLDHSFVGYIGENFVPGMAATMFPVYFGNTVWQDMVSLEQDDKAGVYFLYPQAPNPGWGMITGKVSSQNGGMFGVSVQAIRASDAAPVLGVVSEADGSYMLFGLPPGDYYAYAESPTIMGESYTYWVMDYYSSADKVPYIQLYKDIQVSSYTQLDAGSTIFLRAGAIPVAADGTVSGVDFNYTLPSPPPATNKGDDDDDEDSGCGCVLNPRRAVSGPELDLASVSALFLLFGLGLRSLRRRESAA